jgi:hypothetical protein
MMKQMTAGGGRGGRGRGGRGGRGGGQIDPRDLMKMLK